MGVGFASACHTDLEMSRGIASALIVVDTLDPQLEAALGQHGFQAAVATDLSTAARLVTSKVFDVVLVSGATRESSVASIASMCHACAETPIVALGRDDEELVRAALRAGAVDYLVWPSDSEGLERALEIAKARGRANVPRTAEPNQGSGFIGSSPQLRAARETLSRVAPGNATVLIRGETGTGKDLAARAIHADSFRRRMPFTKVHTPAVPDALLESELFGYEKGAFTGAHARKPGRVELAEGGTLFLDEIGEISPSMQAKLLRLIQDREYERLGGTRTLTADIRIVAATHRDLEHRVETGSFREDLFYRLNVVSIWLPPLRARRADITLIAQHYLSVFCAKNGKQLTFEDAALRILEAERWPGNVRQLLNIVERLVLLSLGHRITSDDVRCALDDQLDFLTQAAPGEGTPLSTSSDSPAGLDVGAPEPSTLAQGEPEPSVEFSSAVRPLKEDVRRTEFRAITKALHYAKGNRALAARLLGVSRRTLYTKLEEHGLD